jgi:hypothetical protein
MTRKMMRAKIHRATVTQADVDYEGSITIDRTLMDATKPAEQAVCVWNVTSGNRRDVRRRGRARLRLHLRERRRRCLVAR